MVSLFQTPTHRNVMFHDLSEGSMVQANQHLIVSNGEGMILDPGGHKVYTKLFAQSSEVVSSSKLKYIFLSHQDPDIVAALNGWLMVTEADAYISEIWTRFVTHFGIDGYAARRIKPIPDGGMSLELGGTSLTLLPAHFLHSAGNFHVYDPVSKILYSGDLGTSLGANYTHVTDFDAHVQYMQGFHQRFMPSSRALKRWAQMARGLDIETMAPQHGAVFASRDLVRRFIDWAEALECGVDLIPDAYAAP